MMSWAAAASARSPAPLYDPVSLNIGLACQWQQRCIDDQNRAMKRALKYVRNKQPPAWRLQTCNRNASRKHFRVDWVGFDNCIRNAAVRPLPARSIKRRARTLTQGNSARSVAAGSATVGERGR
ncbi:MAG TPA: hypothetical protein VF757_05425 [Sphingomicrobium sp.]